MQSGFIGSGPPNLHELEKKMMMNHRLQELEKDFLEDKTTMIEVMLRL